MRSLHTKLTKLISGIIFSGFLISLYCGTLPVYAEEIRTNVDLIAEIEPTLQVIIPTSISLNLTPNLDGSPVFVSRDLNILVATNNPTGYHLSLQTNSTNLTNNAKDKDGHYPILETISSELSEADFTVNRWGYKYNTTNYFPFQTNINLAQTTAPTNEDNITLTFAAKADITKPAGTYSLALNFTAVTNMIPGVLTINYDGNGATSGSIVSQKIEMGTSQKLAINDTENNNGFTRNDYVFLNWNTKPDGTGTSYSENELYTTNLTTENKSLTLYAQWVPTIQTFSLTDCQTKASNSNFTVGDARDNNIYTVRYINGNCWMTQNLRLASGTKLTPNDSNITANYTIPNNDLTLGNSYTEGRVHNSGNESEGYWYNYCATSAGTLCSNAFSATSTYDICPKGWRLPTSAEGNSVVGYPTEFQILVGGG